MQTGVHRGVDSIKKPDAVGRTVPLILKHPDNFVRNWRDKQPQKDEKLQSAMLGAAR